MCVWDTELTGPCCRMTSKVVRNQENLSPAEVAEDHFSLKLVGAFFLVVRMYAYTFWSADHNPR